jgi:plastocyanin
MKKSAWVIIVIVLVVLIGGGLLLANKNSDNDTAANNKTNDTSNMSTSESSNSNDTSNSTTPAATDKVEIKNMAFSPADITVKVGTAVTWTNNDSIAHDVTEHDDQTGPDSGLLQPGKSYTFTYSKAGTYKYFCSIHPNMTGTVTVTES